VKDRSGTNKYLRKIKVNLGTKIGICILTYSVAIRYSTTWRVGSDTQYRTIESQNNTYFYATGWLPTDAILNMFAWSSVHRDATICYHYSSNLLLLSAHKNYYSWIYMTASVPRQRKEFQHGWWFHLTAYSSYYQWKTPWSTADDCHLRTSTNNTTQTSSKITLKIH